MNIAESPRGLVVNADDFGQSHAVNRGVITAHERGIVTSASLMVRWPTSSEAAAYAREHPELSLGLHVDFGEWAYSDEAWTPIYVIDAVDPAAEVAHQLDLFRCARSWVTPLVRSVSRSEGRTRASATMARSTANPAVVTPYLRQSAWIPSCA